jgi:hypothetical protein
MLFEICHYARLLTLLGPLSGVQGVRIFISRQWFLQPPTISLLPRALSPGQAKPGLAAEARRMAGA